MGEGIRDLRLAWRSIEAPKVGRSGQHWFWEGVGVDARGVFQGIWQHAYSITRHTKSLIPIAAYSREAFEFLGPLL